MMFMLIKSWELLQIDTEKERERVQSGPSEPGVGGGGVGAFAPPPHIPSNIFHK